MTPQGTHHSSRVHLKQCITPHREISCMHAFNWGRKFFTSGRVSVSLPMTKAHILVQMNVGKQGAWCQLPLWLSREVCGRVGTVVQREIKSSYWSACTFNCRNKSSYLCSFGMFQTWLCLMDTSYLFCLRGNNIWTVPAVSIVLYKYESISVFRMCSVLMRSYLWNT